MCVVASKADALMSHSLTVSSWGQYLKDKEANPLRDTALILFWLFQKLLLCCSKRRPEISLELGTVHSSSHCNVC